MNIRLLTRIRSYLSGGQLSDTLADSGISESIRTKRLHAIDEACDARINAMTNVEIIALISKTLGPAISAALSIRENEQ